MTEWKLYDPDFKKPHAIILFDDGLQAYKEKENEWFICGEWKGKIRILNKDRKTYINSISAWKVIPHINTDVNKYFIP